MKDNIDILDRVNKNEGISMQVISYQYGIMKSTVLKIKSNVRKMQSPNSLHS